MAARPLAGLQQNPPEIDIFFGAADEIEVDPQIEWIMVSILYLQSVPFLESCLRKKLSLLSVMVP